MRKLGKFEIVAIIMGIIIGAMYMLAFSMGNRSRALQGDSGENLLISLENQWEELPGRAEVQTYRYRLSEKESMMLSLTASDCPFDIFLGEEKIFHFENAEKINLRPAYFLELPGDNAGQELRMVVSGSAAQGESICSSAYIGSHRAVIVYFLRRTIYTCFISVFLLILGCILLFVSLSLHRKKEQKNYGDMGFSYLGLFMAAAGIWMLNDSQFLMLFTKRYWKLGLLSSVAFCFMPVFLLLFVRKMLRGGIKQGDQGKYLKYFTFPHLGVLFVYLGLYAVGSTAKEYILPVEHTLVIITLLACLGECIREVRSTGNREIRKIVVGFGVFSFFCVMAFVCFYFVPQIPYFGMYLLGFLIFSIILANAAIHRMVEVIHSGAETETYQRLAYTDLMTGLGNRTAYMEECRNMEQPQICIMLDVNGLKSVNDNQGHQEGDELIMAAARSVKVAFEPLGRCFRMGGDEFVVVLEVRYQNLLAQMLGELKEAVERENASRNFPLSIAYGYAVPRDESDSFERVYREADEKMYDKKREMKGKV